MNSASLRSPTASESSAATSSTAIKGLANWRSNSAARLGTEACGRRLGPSAASRRSASAPVRPSALPEGKRACQGVGSFGITPNL